MTHAPRARRRRTAARSLGLGITAALVGAGLGSAASPAGAVEPPDVGGFQIIKEDLEFILRQIEIAEAHTAGGALLGPGEDQVNNPLLGEGLRTVTGDFNNLLPGRTKWGAADTQFPRLLTPNFRTAEPPPGPPGVPAGPATSYTQNDGVVFDSQPRTVSNLVVDQTVDNPAALAAAERMGTDGDLVDVDGDPDTPPDGLFIPNTATDAGLSARSNAWFTFFGQFFDHGLDLVTKGDSGTVLVPLQADDPLYDPASPTNFMVLTRATKLPGEDGEIGTDDDIAEHTNTTTPFVDQNQTYTSHPSHQVFLREYALNAAGRPVPTGHMLEGATGGLATWADVKAQASSMLGITLQDTDVVDVPLLLTDLYGGFTPGGDGRAQRVAGRTTGHAFLDDIAHHAVPGGGRTPDADPGTGDDGDDETYDDEMLDAHFVTGDGRGNENIGLTAVHHVFHSEHNRVVEDVKAVVDAQTDDPAFQAEWHLAAGAGGWHGERLFQAARLVTEMEYQHLVFEEFARKISPNIDVVPVNESGYQPDLRPDISAEFAHVVYRFGHSMLTEDVARVSPEGEDLGMDLFEAFLNPPAFLADGMTPEEAAGSIVRGNISTVGNEIDEFVTGVLRNRLVGLPLDLPTLNMVRARETGVPSLNSARRQFHAESGDPTVAPYTSWLDFGAQLRNPESLVNFVAAYGLHPTVTGATTVAEKRAAASLLVDGGAGAPDDRSDFMNRTGAWAPVDGQVVTGLDAVDFWAGGLAEKPRVFGSMLGSTFNWVFEQQLENLQFGDRFYYLSRLIGTNLLGQLEANSFAALIERNTDARNLPIDTFATPDCTIDLSEVVDPDGALPSVEHCGEGARLVREPDGTIRFLGPQHVHVIGRAGPDRLRTDEGDDTVVGSDGADRIEGGDGNDGLVGGAGDDVLLDLNGDDTIKGGAGDDAINAGPGLDLVLSGSGQDFIFHGSDETESFGGLHDDFIRGGNASDVIAGNDGHDWLEGGNGTDLVQGDNRNGFQDDPNGGDDVLIAVSGNDDYDAEGGDDVMVAGSGSNRNEGMLGFDWVTNARNALPANDDMSLVGGLPPNVAPLSDRFDLVEGLSGWNHDDVLRGDNRAADTEDELALAGHELTDVGRFVGLAALLPAGTTTFTGGNILLGGGGSDTIEPRGGDDVVDGDAWLDVEIASGDSRWTSLSQIQAAVFAGTLDPGSLTIVRTVRAGTPGAADVDAVVFSGNRSEYTVTPRLNRALMTVSHTGGTQADGVDRLRNVERLVFADETVEIPQTPPNEPATGTVTISDTTPAENQSLTASAVVDDLDGVVPDSLVLQWQAESAPDTWTNLTTGATFVPNDSEVGMRLRVVARITDGQGVLESVSSDPTAAVTNVNDAPTGAAVLSTTDVLEGETLTVDTSTIADADGLGTLAVRWQAGAVGGGTPFVNVAGATGTSFTPGNAQVNRRLRAVVAWTDARGTAQQVFSVPTGLVGDLFVGTGAANVWNGTTVRDQASGGGGNDTLNASNGPDLLSGDAGDDTVNAGGGDDTIRFAGTTGGFDAVFGGPGFDRLVALTPGTAIGLRTFGGVEEISGGVVGGVRITGPATATTWDFSGVALTGITDLSPGGGNDTVTGSTTADRIDGGDGGDVLNGGSGDDALFGQAGIDRLRGDLGDDVLDGGPGNDLLLFPAAFGNDTVNGFDAVPGGGQDRLVLTGLGITGETFGTDVTIAPAPGGTGTLVTVQGTSTITLTGVPPAAVTIADFTL